jgi:hypothetical protein
MIERKLTILPLRRPIDASTCSFSNEVKHCKGNDENSTIEIVDVQGRRNVFFKVRRRCRRRVIVCINGSLKSTR